MKNNSEDVPPSTGKMTLGSGAKKKVNKNSFPHGVKVGGHIIEIRDVETILNKKTGFKLGKFHTDAGFMQIAQKNSDDEHISESTRYATLIHEIFHAIDYYYNFARIGEQQTGIMAEGLFQVIRDNPNLFKRIWEI